MHRLTYRKVFSKYNISLSDKLARISYSAYKNYCLHLSKYKQLDPNELYILNEQWMKDEASDTLPLGYNYHTQQHEEGFLRLEHIDFFDYLPKENLDSFRAALNVFVNKNKLSMYSVYRTKQEERSIDSIGRYIDRHAFTNLCSVIPCHNDKLQQHVTQITIELRNLSTSFLLIKYRFYINDEFNSQIHSLCKTQYSPSSDVSRRASIPWYKPKQFGRTVCTGNNARAREMYKLLSNLKWEAFKELSRYFTINFENDRFFPPSFDTYSTNIRPASDNNNWGFWNSVMFGHHIDYAPTYNACVVWDYECTQHPSIALACYCGGTYPGNTLPEIAEYTLSDTYAVYMTAHCLNLIAERDIAKCNKKIGKVIRKKRTAPLLKTRVDVERKLYYCYRFISEFSGNTIDHSDEKDFKHFIKGIKSSTSSALNNISKTTLNTKKEIDNLLAILNNAAEYRNAKTNFHLQWQMMFITVLSLLVAIIALFDFSYSDIKNFLCKILEWCKNLLPPTA